MLRGGPGRRRHRRQRLNALALARHHQAGAVIAQRVDPIRVADHAGQALNVSRKATVAAVRTLKTHPGSPAKNESSEPTSSPADPIRGLLTHLFDSVRLVRYPKSAASDDVDYLRRTPFLARTRWQLGQKPD